MARALQQQGATRIAPGRPIVQTEINPHSSATSSESLAVPRTSSSLAAAWSKHLQQLLESTSEGIFGVDLQGRCLFINRSGAQMLGWRTEQVLGQNMRCLIHHPHGEARLRSNADSPLHAPVQKAIEKGLSMRVDTESLWRADGSSFHAEYCYAPIFESGVVQGAMVTFVDVSTQKRTEQLLLQAQTQVEERVQLRTQELTLKLEQLRELSTHAEVIRETELAEMADQVQKNLGSLLMTLKLDLDGLEAQLAQQPELQSKCADMGALVNRSIDSVGQLLVRLHPNPTLRQGLWSALEWQLQQFAEDHGLHHDLQLHIAPGVTLPSTTPEGQRWATAVWRIFQEMLVNAARHAHPKSLTVRVHVNSPPNATLHLEVRDDGHGAPLAQFSKSGAHGLAQMQERARQFGGHIYLDSMPHQGTLVRLNLPLPTSFNTTSSAG